MITYLWILLLNENANLAALSFFFKHLFPFLFRGKFDAIDRLRYIHNGRQECRYTQKGTVTM